jgi:hypothetical protein
MITKVSVAMQALQEELSNELDNMLDRSTNGNPLNTTKRRIVTLLRLYTTILKFGSSYMSTSVTPRRSKPSC